jgi:23S rRNA maturation mini-RNase III
MPFRVSKLRVRFSVRKAETHGGQGAALTMHRFKVAVRKAPGQTVEGERAMLKEIEAEIERRGRNSDPEAIRAAVDAIAERHGATIERFEEH